MVFTRKDGDFLGLAVSFKEGNRRVLEECFGCTFGPQNHEK